MAPEEAWVPFPFSSHPTLTHCASVPYLNPSNALQNLAVWLPSERAASATAHWIVYVHGGAWRDPLITSSSFAATVTHLAAAAADSSTSSTSSTRIAGFASINYSLSPHPSHPSDDPSRLAKHPRHITDVLAALSYLQRRWPASAERYVLVGHSCGATLALQTVMGREKLGVPPPGQNGEEWQERPAPPAAIVGLNGLYDLPTLTKDPGGEHGGLREVYEEFTRGAFGDDERTWRQVSPQFESDWSGWSARRRGGATAVAVLAQSLEDTLVPYAQTAAMLEALKEHGGDAGIAVVEERISGDHNVVWEDGRELSELIRRLLDSMGVDEAR